MVVDAFYASPGAPDPGAGRLHDRRARHVRRPPASWPTACCSRSAWVQLHARRRRADRGSDRRRPHRRCCWCARRRGSARPKPPARAETPGAAARGSWPPSSRAASPSRWRSPCCAARPGADACAGGVAQHRSDRRRQSDHRRADGVPRDGHDARGDRAAARADRRLVARARPRLGRPAGAALRRRSRRHPRLHCARAAADRHRRRRLHPLGRRRPSGRQVPGRDDRGRDVAAGDDGRACRCAADASAWVRARCSSPVRSCSSRSACIGVCTAGAFLGYPDGLREAADPRHRVRAACPRSRSRSASLLAGAPERRRTQRERRHAPRARARPCSSASASTA